MASKATKKKEKVSDWVTAPEAAKILGVRRQAIYWAIKNGKVKAKRVNDKDLTKPQWAVSLKSIRARVDAGDYRDNPTRYK